MIIGRTLSITSLFLVMLANMAHAKDCSSPIQGIGARIHVSKHGYEKVLGAAGRYLEGVFSHDKDSPLTDMDQYVDKIDVGGGFPLVDFSNLNMNGLHFVHSPDVSCGADNVCTVSADVDKLALQLDVGERDGNNQCTKFEYTDVQLGLKSGTKGHLEFKVKMTGDLSNPVEALSTHFDVNPAGVVFSRGHEAKPPLNLPPRCKGQGFSHPFDPNGEAESLLISNLLGNSRVVSKILNKSAAGVTRNLEQKIAPRLVQRYISSGILASADLPIGPIHLKSQVDLLMASNAAIAGDVTSAGECSCSAQQSGISGLSDACKKSDMVFQMGLAPFNRFLSSLVQVNSPDGTSTVRACWNASTSHLSAISGGCAKGDEQIEMHNPSIAYDASKKAYVVKAGLRFYDADSHVQGTTSFTMTGKLQPALNGGGLRFVPDDTSIPEADFHGVGDSFSFSQLKAWLAQQAPIDLAGFDHQAISASVQQAVAEHGSFGLAGFNLKDVVASPDGQISLCGNFPSTDQEMDKLIQSMKDDAPNSQINPIPVKLETE